MIKNNILTPKNEQVLTGEIFSPYDTLEVLNFQAQKILSLIDEFENPDTSVKKLINKVKDEISKLLREWEEAVESKRFENYENSKLFTSLYQQSSKQPQKDSKDEMLQTENSFEEKVKSLENLLKISEENKQRIHSFHQDCLRQLDRDLDEIIHDYKQKYKKQQPIGNILEELFSNEELEQERQVALGKIRESFEIKISKIEDSKDEKWDMNLDSEESSGPPTDLEGTGLLLYERLHELKTKLYKLRHEDFENKENQVNSLDQAFLGSLPVSMQSISSSQSLKLNQMLSSLCQSLEENEIPFEFHDQILTIDEKENFIMTLIDKQGTNGYDVCLEDILSEQTSEKKIQKLENSLSFLENSVLKVQQLENSLSFLENSVLIKKTQENSKKNEKKDLKNNKPDFDIRLSPINTPKNLLKKKNFIDNLSQESSIAINDNTSSFISENSFINEDRRKFKNPKKSEKSILRRPKISDYDDSNSSIFPPINTSSDDQSFRMPIDSKLKRLPLVPCKPICAPPKERFNVRGRSLLPIQNSVGNSPKIVLGSNDMMNKSASPNTVANLRMRRYKEMTRPFIKIVNNKLTPKEPASYRKFISL
jgi:hypothetical protein